jgi:hypothetical protein
MTYKLRFKDEKLIIEAYRFPDFYSSLQLNHLETFKPQKNIFQCCFRRHPENED